MDDAQTKIDAAPRPCAQELKRRSNVAVQFFRFLNLNWTMYMLARRH